MLGGGTELLAGLVQDPVFYGYSVLVSGYVMARFLLAPFYRGRTLIVWVLVVMAFERRVRGYENLFWAGRYVERAQDTARMLDATYHHSAGLAPELSARAWANLLRALRVLERERRECRLCGPQAVVDGALRVDLADRVDLAHRGGLDRAGPSAGPDTPSLRLSGLARLRLA